MSETSFIFALLALIYAVIMFLLPFFVMRIRREVIAINNKMSRIEDQLVQLSGKLNLSSASHLKSDERGRPIRICENCGRKNALQDARCMGCGEILQ